MSLDELLKIPVAELLPHSAPMVLIDRIQDFGDNDISCVSIFRNPDFFKSPTGVPITWGIEIIAQACAIFVSINMYGTGITQGRLLKCKYFDCNEAELPYNKPLIIEATRTVTGASGLWMFEGRIKPAEGRPYLEGEMSILVK